MNTEALAAIYRFLCERSRAGGPDDAEVPRPSLADASSHTGISPPGTRELPAQDTTWDDTVVQCAAELLLGPVDTRTISNKDSVWPDRLENHLYLATCYTGMHRRMLDAYAAELSAIDGLNVRP